MAETMMTTPPPLELQSAFTAEPPTAAQPSPRTRRPSMLDDSLDELPPKAFSAPGSLLQSRRSSRPGSGKARLQRALSFARSAPTSPTKAIKKHVPAATFGTAPKNASGAHARAALCPVHSYSAMPLFKPKGGAVPFGSKPAEKANDACPAHAYLSPRTTLKTSGSATFGSAPLRRYSDAPSDGPQVHSYAPVASTLKTSGATAFGRAPSRESLRPRHTEGTAHAYGGLYSSFSSKGGTLARYGRQDQAWEKRALCPSHSYGALPSTLKTSGVAAFPRAGLPKIKSAAILPPIAPMAAAVC